MVGRLVTVTVLLATCSGAHAADRAASRTRLIAAPVLTDRASDLHANVATLRLVDLDPGIDDATFRIAPTTPLSELMPGDRPTTELCATPAPDRPREPGAPMKARMSMRLDNSPDAMRPAFALGGIGGALMRVTDALFDD